MPARLHLTWRYVCAYACAAGALVQKPVDAEAVRNWFYGQERGKRGPHLKGIRFGKFARSGQSLVHQNVQQHSGVPLNKYNEAQRHELKKVT
jgi:hypothetical protein